MAINPKLLELLREVYFAECEGNVYPKPVAGFVETLFKYVFSQANEQEELYLHDVLWNHAPERLEQQAIEYLADFLAPDSLRQAYRHLQDEGEDWAQDYFSAGMGVRNALRVAVSTGTTCCWIKFGIIS